MEVEGAILLYALAGMMVTFAGFSALLLTLRPAAGARLSLLDRYLARTVLTNLFSLTAGALLPPVIALYGLPQSVVWRVSAALFGVPMLCLLLTFPYRRRKVVGKGPPPSIAVIFVGVGSAALFAMLVYVLAGFRFAAAAYITALVVNFLTVAFAFVTAMDVIMQQPADAAPTEPPC